MRVALSCFCLCLFVAAIPSQSFADIYCYIDLPPYQYQNCGTFAPAHIFTVNNFGLSNGVVLDFQGYHAGFSSNVNALVWRNGQVVYTGNNSPTNQQSSRFQTFTLIPANMLQAGDQVEFVLNVADPNGSQSYYSMQISKNIDNRNHDWATSFFTQNSCDFAHFPSQSCVFMGFKDLYCIQGGLCEWGNDPTEPDYNDFKAWVYGVTASLSAEVAPERNTLQRGAPPAQLPAASASQLLKGRPMVDADGSVEGSMRRGEIPAALTQNFSVIHTFTGSGGDGAYPTSGVTRKDPLLYGTTAGPASGNGTVYQITPMGNNWLTTPISLLSPTASQPRARIVFGPDGHPYGTTWNGSANPGGVFDLIVPLTICKTVACFWKENVLYSFAGPPNDGSNPGPGDLVWDAQGNIYGTTSQGGAQEEGTVYQMTKSGNNWTEAPIYDFSGSDGDTPYGGVILDSNGNVYGTTFLGGDRGYGTVFQLTFLGEWIDFPVYNFQNNTDGAQPTAGLIFDSLGNLYGTTSDGGANGGGTVFELSPVGQSWKFTLLYSFTGQQGSNCGPRASLVMDGAGNLYGTTVCDGANNLGAVFELTPSGNTWNYSSLHDFTGGNDGAYPMSNVTIDASGNLYGTAFAGGSQNLGVVWEITPQ